MVKQDFRGNQEACTALLKYYRYQSEWKMLHFFFTMQERFQAHINFQKISLIMFALRDNRLVQPLAPKYSGNDQEMLKYGLDCNMVSTLWGKQAANTSLSDKGLENRCGRPVVDLAVMLPLIIESKKPYQLFLSLLTKVYKINPEELAKIEPLREILTDFKDRPLPFHKSRAFRGRLQKSLKVQSFHKSRAGPNIDQTTAKSMTQGSTSAEIQQLR